MEDLQSVQRQLADLTAMWIADNSKECTCGAQIQRAGGCNHMICTVCGRHFCYTCGQDWEPHRRQPGGFDYFRCSLPAGAAARNTPGAVAPAAGDPAAEGHGQQLAAQRQRMRKLQRLERECLPGWLANHRDAQVQRKFLACLTRLARSFGQHLGSPGGTAIANRALQALLEARSCLQACYGQKYHWTNERWRSSRLQTWVGELESAASSLETVLGLVLVEDAVVAAGYSGGGAAASSTPAQRRLLPPDEQELLRQLDLRQIAPHTLAVSFALDAVQQLSLAVSLQTSRICESGRVGFPDHTIMASLETFAERAAQALGISRSRGGSSPAAPPPCTVM